MDRYLTIEREFPAPVHAVYAAWTRPESLKLWVWGSLGHNVDVSLDLRVGGEYVFTTERPEGDHWTMSGRYIEIEPNKRLVYTVNWSAPMGYGPVEETVDVRFMKCDNGTRVVFQHTGPPQAALAEHERGWLNTFDLFEIVL